MKEDNNIEAVRHSLSHLLAYSVKQLYPGAQNAIGPAIENGFYQDFEIKDTISDESLPIIEQKMKEVLKTWQGFERKEVSLDEALEIFSDNKYKQQLAREFAEAGKILTVYTSGEFVDLCSGGHVDDIKSINPDGFTLTKTAGAYWKGNEKNIMLTRIYGLAFSTKQELVDYLQMLEEAKKRDHRVLGEKLKLFFISESVGTGLPLLMPRGEKVKSILMNYMREKEEARGYQYVATPVLTQRKLYERSGHAEYYLDNMYATEKDEEGNQFFLKPMNCPHHHMIFEKLVESYRDLPLRLSEHAGLYRYELSGTLTGLIRMRGPITQNDSHAYVTPEQLKKEFLDLLELFNEVYKETGIEDYWFRLSLPDFSKEKYAGDKKQWEWAAEAIRDCLISSKSQFVEVLDEAAFYGPKLDIQIKNVLGNEDTIATVQVDILVPERMGITYIDTSGEKQFPIVIHKSIMGAFERFMAFLLEQTSGNLPIWLAPEQLRIIQVKDSAEVQQFVDKVDNFAKENKIRTIIDRSNETVGKKIRAAELLKIPYIVVVGEKEVASSQLRPRIRSDLAVENRPETGFAYENFIHTIANEAKSRVQKSSL